MKHGQKNIKLSIQWCLTVQSVMWRCRSNAPRPCFTS